VKRLGFGAHQITLAGRTALSQHEDDGEGGR
jgi:hypothetical protein